MGHQRKPIFLDEEYAYIGRPPSSARVGYPSYRLYQYIKNWLSQQQIFIYTATKGSTDTDDTDTDGTFYVIMHNAPKNDASNPTRQLGGKLIPWKCEPDYAGGSVTKPVRIKWYPTLAASAETLVSCNTVVPVGTIPGPDTGWELSTTEDADFDYTPDGSGNWVAGKLTTENIKTSTLGIWTMPDWSLTDVQSDIFVDYYAPGNYLKGAVTGGHIGELIHDLYLEGSGGWDDDTVERQATRCLFQWGHPIGVWSDQNSYYDLGPSGTTYRISIPDYYSFYGSEIEIYPTVVCSATNASGGDPAYVKLHSTGGNDNWELEITSDAVALYDYTDASNDTLSAQTGVDETFSIDIMAPSGGEILLHTVALWAHCF